MKNKTFLFLLCICLVFVILTVPMMGCSTLVEGTCASVKNCALFAGYAGGSCIEGAFPGSLTKARYIELERKWVGEGIVIETFVFGGKTAKATVTIEGTQYELEVTDLRGAEVFKFPITEEDEKFFEENGYMKSRNFWYTTSELNGETLTITVERDYGHNDGLYFSDFTGRTFVLTEQSRVL